MRDDDEARRRAVEAFKERGGQVTRLDPGIASGAFPPRWRLGPVGKAQGMEEAHRQQAADKYRDIRHGKRMARPPRRFE